MHREECEASKLNWKAVFINVFYWQIAFKSTSLQLIRKVFISWEQAWCPFCFQGEHTIPINVNGEDSLASREEKTY